MKKHSDYFYTMFWILLMLVFIGFAPSFYLKPLVPEQPLYPDGLPNPHVIHGIILTIWYIFLVVQSGWIKYKKFHIHRMLGWFGAAWAALVLASTIWVITVFPDRMEQLAQQQNSTVDEVEPGLISILWLDIFMCALFIGCFTIAIIKRNQSVIHKRLMLYTGIAFIFAAVFRVGGITSYLLDSNVGMLFSLLILVSLTVSLLIHDYKKLGKIQPVSWWCFGLYWLAIVLSNVIAETAFGSIILIILKQT
jgi:hypothetical protein